MVWNILENRWKLSSYPLEAYDHCLNYSHLCSYLLFFLTFAKFIKTWSELKYCSFKQFLMAREETWAGNYGSGAINGVCHSHLLWMVTHSSQDFNLSNVWQVLRATCACFLSHNITSQINSNKGIKWKGLQPSTPLQWGCLSKGLSILYFFPGPYFSLKY